jgi:hypothetical protein
MRLCRRAQCNCTLSNLNVLALKRKYREVARPLAGRGPSQFRLTKSISTWVVVLAGKSPKGDWRRTSPKKRRTAVWVSSPRVRTS